MDTVLDYRGFPTWYGGNAKESRAAGNPLVFDMDLDDPNLDVAVDTTGDETNVRGRVHRTKLNIFKAWLKKRFGRRR
jgi:hypothetical protein